MYNIIFIFITSLEFNTFKVSIVAKCNINEIGVFLNIFSECQCAAQYTIVHHTIKYFL